MKKKEFNALGFMSGTSMDGVDLSLIESDGIADFTSILNNFYEFDNDLRPINHYYLGDPEDIANRTNAVANQAKKKN